MAVCARDRATRGAPLALWELSVLVRAAEHNRGAGRKESASVLEVPVLLQPNLNPGE